MLRHLPRHLPFTQITQKMKNWNEKRNAVKNTFYQRTLFSCVITSEKTLIFLCRLYSKDYHIEIYLYILLPLIREYVLDVSIDNSYIRIRIFIYNLNTKVRFSKRYFKIFFKNMQLRYIFLFF